MSKASTCLGWFLGIAIISSANSALAQITPDSTLGVERSLLTPNVQINGALGDRIEGGAQRGSNLFHSFSQFNINNAQRVYFANPTGIQNILTRVTGKESSNIFGTLGVQGSANLFFLNPNGILFGQNARLDVRGSFLGTTANSFVFPNALEFSATNPQAPPLLTINVPIGLQFGSQPGGITSQGNELDVSRSTLALIGGQITLDGSTLFANNGQVQLGATGGETTVDLNVNGSNLNFNLPENASRAPITLNNGAFVATSGDSAIKLVGGQINLNNGSFISGQNGGSISISATGLGLDNGSLIATGTQGATKAGDIQIQASDAVTVANGSQIFSQSGNSATGNGGNIAINARKIAVTGDGTEENSSIIRTFTLGQGNAGNLTLNATDSVNINGGNLGMFTTGSGSTGNLRIETGTLRVENANAPGGVTAIAAGSGSVGSISIQARDAVEVINSAINAQVASSGTGRAGDIIIDTPQVNLKDGGQVRTDTFSSAKASNIVIRASEFVDISGVSPSASNGVQTSQVSSGTTSGATGNGGNITIETPRLSLNQGGSVSTSSFKSRGNAGNITIRAKDVQLDGFVRVPNERLPEQFQSPSGGLFSLSELNSEVQGSDLNVRGGTITIDTERLRLSNGANVSISVFLGRGQGGNLVVRATDSIDITGFGGGRRTDGSFAPSGLSAELQTGGIGSGGNISVETGRLNLSNGGQISASTFNQGNAGDIAIQANQIDLRGENTFITTTVQREARGNGGNISINSDRLIVGDGAEVSSGTFGRGNAGNLTIQANQIELFNTGGLVTTTSSGNAGDLTINTQRLTLRNGGLVQASTASGSTGRGGNLTINARDSVEVIGSSNDNRFRSNLSVRSLGEGQAGNIIVNSPRISVADRGTINAESSTTDGGNINLNTNLLLLRRGAKISATAGLAQGAGKGGNITINAPDGFIVAVPTENSDITANAFAGSGGRVDITAQGIYGIEPRSSQTDLSDITASSESGVQGTIQINTSYVDPNRGLLQLPTGLVNTPGLVASNCNAFIGKKGSEFTVTGRGGLPPSPDDFLSPDVVWTDTRLSATTAQQNKPKTPVVKSPSKPKAIVIVPATGWVFNDKGEVTLISSAPNTTGLGYTPASCLGR
ncbi:MAG: filamentous hemagglutinin N-terminal domain-containing protein [Spirirestis rafaelensis WJT71-NPBG6]|jgi:filamentous hemagglutinin family protein|nr:filamentous hemagglutinin N-terminal domain-containing protein [Spirirestis rafaelensis WJT71-NPBG6]